jgi:hypothetical protein
VIFRGNHCAAAPFGSKGAAVFLFFPCLFLAEDKEHNRHGSGRRDYDQDYEKGMV